MEKLLTPAEVIALLGIPERTFHYYQRRGFFREAEAAHPLGHRRYVKATLEKMFEARSAARGPFARKRSA